MGFGIHGASYKQSLLILRNDCSKKLFLDLYFIPPAAEVPKGALFPSIVNTVPCQSLSRVRLCDAMDHSLPGCPWNFPDKHTGVGCPFLILGSLPDPGIEPVSPALAGGFCTALCHLGSVALLIVVGIFNLSTTW